MTRYFMISSMCFGLSVIGASAAFGADLGAVYSKIADIQTALQQHGNEYSDADIQAILTNLEQARQAAASPSQGGADIANACANGFGSNSTGAQCAQGAHSAAAVTACVNGFGANSSGLQCALGAWDGKAVSACTNGFGANSSGLDCATNSKNAGAVSACVNGFGANSTGLACADKANDGARVSACINQFGANSTGLNCAIGQ